jgi:DNA-directed RNA polymerase specialized sigma24 family protein
MRALLTLQTTQTPTAEFDPLLQPLLTGDEALAERALAALLAEHAEPRIREIVGYKLRAYAAGSVAGLDAEDVRGEIILQLVARLAAFRNSPQTHAIANFRSYVAVTAFRACYDHLRRKYPQRYALKHRVRYALAQQPQLACWEAELEQWACGLAGWQLETNRAVLRSTAELRARPQTFAQTLPRGTAHGLPLSRLLEAFFRWLDQPVELDELVNFIADLQGVNDQARESSMLTGAEEDARLALERLPERRANQAEELEQQRYLAQLWQEIAQMPPRHCAALLLNLKDDEGGSALDLFLFTGAATLPQIAAALGLSKDELLELWNRLPLDDAALAARLGLRRQQVINLRQTARARLRRRLRESGG